MAIRRKTLPGVAANYIHGRSFLKQVERTVLWRRVSGRQQKRRKNLRDQDAWLKQALTSYGVEVLKSYWYVGPGTEISRKFRKAIAYARRHGAVLVAESTDRFIRHPAYHSNDNPDAQAGIRELEVLSAAAGEVPLVTMLHPDASPKRVRSHQRIRGQTLKQQKGGGDRMPGFKKRLRERMLPRVIALSKEMGNDRIARITGVPKQTIRSWRQRYRPTV